jgi:hypothetical protein
MMAGGDWRDTAIIVWNLDLTVAGEKDAVDDGKIKKKEGCWWWTSGWLLELGRLREGE